MGRATLWGVTPSFSTPGIFLRYQNVHASTVEAKVPDATFHRRSIFSRQYLQDLKNSCNQLLLLVGPRR